MRKPMLCPSEVRTEDLLLPPRGAPDSPWLSGMHASFQHGDAAKLGWVGRAKSPRWILPEPVQSVSPGQSYLLLQWVPLPWSMALN